MKDELTSDEQYVLAALKSDVAPSPFGEQLFYLVPSGLIFGLGVYYSEPLISGLGFGIYALMNFRLVIMQQKYDKALRSLITKLEGSPEGEPV